MSALRYGWTTGACATAATKAAYTALLTGSFPQRVSIVLPKGQTPTFPLAVHSLQTSSATAGVIKDAGDDPDVTHGALILSTVQPGVRNSGVVLKAGEGVGTVTRLGLPIPVGSAAINPVPQKMIREVISELATRYNVTGDVVVTLSIPEGERLAEKTWNPRLGILGGLSILGTTGIVVPYSCSAWIHSIHRGVDVARAAGLNHIGAATGNTSEQALRSFYQLPEYAIIDMGDFVGGLLKYLRKHPIPYLTIAGGFAKMTKLAQGALDLHSKRSTVDFEWIVTQAQICGVMARDVQALKTAESAAHVQMIASQRGLSSLLQVVATAALKTVQRTLVPTNITADIMIVDRQGKIIAKTTGC